MVAGRLKSLVASAFYKHGQFCSAHPWPVITFVSVLILIASYPVSNLPLPGTAPMEFSSPYHGFRVPLPRSKGPIHDPGVEGIVAPRWFSGSPVGFIQQFIINATVSPWQRGLIPEDAFRLPLYKAFAVRQDIEDYENIAGKSVRSFCLYVTEPVSDCKDTMPEHNCLMVSPAGIWGDDERRFKEDAKLVNSIFKSQGSMEAMPSIKDLLFGIPAKHTGINRFYIRNRQRQISYAVTLVLQTYNETFIEGLKHYLTRRHDVDSSRGRELDDEQEKEQIVHIYYQNNKGLLELSPLIIIYILLLLYMYFSIRKIEMVKSKWGMASAAVIMIMASLSSSLGICLMFGLTPSLSGSEVFPYLVVMIGLENVLVFTKSVVSTPVDLAVNIRIAQGLSKEGWSITTNLCAELLVVFFGFFTFVPAIQEFCLFVLVGLMTDFFLQMFYFVPVLAVDIRRMELSDLSRKSVQCELAADSALTADRPPTRPLARSKSAPRSLNKMVLSSSLSSSVHRYDGSCLVDGMQRTRRRLPRRLRFIYFWASTRLMQRLIMCASIMWIILTIMFMYKSGLVNHLTETRVNQTSPLELRDILALQQDPDVSPDPVAAPPTREGSAPDHSAPNVAPLPPAPELSDVKLSRLQQLAEQLARMGSAGAGGALKRGQLGDLWRKLSMWHWPVLFQCYNMSLRGKYISILPPEYINIVSSPGEAVAFRHERERQRAARWYERLDQELLSYSPDDLYTTWPHEGGTLLFHPPSNFDYYMTMTLGVLSGASLVILIILVFKCVVLMRLRQARYKTGKHEDILKRVVMKKTYEAVPWVLTGHQQEIECLASAGAWIASCCLGGEIRIWDETSGHCTMCIDRHSYFKMRHRKNTRSCYWTGRVPKRKPRRNDVSPREKTTTCPFNRRNGHIDLSRAIVTDFSVNGVTPDPPSCGGDRKNGYNFKMLVDSYLAEEQSRYDELITDDDDDDDLEEDVYPEVLSPNSGFEYKQRPEEPPGHLSAGQSPQEPPPGHLSAGRSPQEPPGHLSAGCSPQEPTGHLSAGRSPQEPPGHLSAGRSPQEPPGHLSAGRSPQEPPSHPSAGRSPQEPPSHLSAGRSPQEPTGHLSAGRSPQEPTGHLSAGRSAQLCTNRFSFDEESVKRSRESSGDPNDPTPLLFGVVPPPVWCMASDDRLVAVGCSNGRIELWDPSSGFLLGYHADCPVGATSLCVAGTHLVVARLDGCLEFFDLITHRSIHVNQALFNDYLAGNNRGKLRSWSTSGFVPLGGAILCSKQASVQAHQQPMNDVQVSHDQVVTASQDRTLKVFRLDDSLCTYTLRGHKGSVTTLYVDKTNSYQIASGSDDGMVRLWNTLTGACLHSLWGHISTVLSVALSQEHVISVGMDNRLCVWKRRRGRMIHLIQLDPGCSGTVATLSDTHMVTGGQGYLSVWDIVNGEPLRVIELGSSEEAVRQIVVTENGRAVVCSYGHELRLVAIPSDLKKTE